MNRMIKMGSLLCLASMAVACGPGPRLVVPAEVSQGSQVLEVVDRSSATGMLANESFKLGAYEVLEVDRDWNSSKGIGIGSYGKDSKTTGYSYELKTSQGSWKGTCASLAAEQSIGSFSLSRSTDVTCQCELKGEKVTVKVGGKDEATGGQMDGFDKSFVVAAIDETDKANYTKGPAGYRVDESDKAYAAVELLRPGRVWLRKGLSEPGAGGTACVLAGLMLYIPPSDN